MSSAATDQQNVSIFCRFIDISSRCVDPGDRSAHRPVFTRFPAPVSASQLPAERPVRQQLFQLVERGKFALVVGFEVLGFGRQTFQLVNDLRLLTDCLGEGNSKRRNIVIVALPDLAYVDRQTEDETDLEGLSSRELVRLDAQSRLRDLCASAVRSSGGGAGWVNHRGAEVAEIGTKWVILIPIRR